MELIPDRMSSSEYRRRLDAGKLRAAEPSATPSDAPKKRRRYPESEIQRATAEANPYILTPKAVPFHVPNERSNPLQRSLQTSFGVLAGVSDWIILHDGRAYAIEIKAPGNSQSKAQKEFEARCVETGIPYAVVTSLDEYERVLTGLGLHR